MNCERQFDDPKNLHTLPHTSVVAYLSTTELQFLNINEVNKCNTAKTITRHLYQRCVENFSVFLPHVRKLSPTYSLIPMFFEFNIFYIF